MQPSRSLSRLIADSSDNWNALYQVGRTGTLSGQNLDRAEACCKLYSQNDFAGKEYRAALELDPELERAKKALKKLKWG